MPTIGEAWDVVVKIFTDVPSSIYKGNNTNTVLSVAAIAIVLLKDWMEEFTSFSLFHNRYVVVRWASYLTVLFLILLFGVLDSSSFIYASF